MFIPLPVIEISHLLGSLTGLLLLFLARGIRLRIDAAWYGSLILLAMGIHGFDAQGVWLAGISGIIPDVDTDAAGQKLFPAQIVPVRYAVFASVDCDDRDRSGGFDLAWFLCLSKYPIRKRIVVAIFLSWTMRPVFCGPCCYRLC